MTPDQIILGVCDADETVLDYLDKLTGNQLEDLFRPMFAVTRPAVAVPKTEPTAKAALKVRAVDAQREARMAALAKKLTPEQMAKLRELM